METKHSNIIEVLVLSAIAAIAVASFWPKIVAAAQDIIAASGTRSATYTSSDIVKGGVYRGALVRLVVSSAAATGDLTLEVQGKDAEGNYYSMLSGAAATSTTSLKVYPGLTAVTNSVASDVLPDAWRIKVNHSGASPWIYSVNANTLP